MKKLLFVFAILAASVGAFGQKPGQNLPGKGGTGGGGVTIIQDSLAIAVDTTEGLSWDAVKGWRLADFTTPTTVYNAILTIDKKGRVRAVPRIQFTLGAYPGYLPISNAETTLGIQGASAPFRTQVSGEEFGGAIQLSTSNSTTAVCGLVNGYVNTSSGNHVLGTKTWVGEGRMKVSALPTTTEDYEMILGFCANVHQVGNTLGFRLRQVAGVVEFQAVTRYNGVETTQSIPIDPTGYFDWSFTASTGNVKFYINGVKLNLDHTANIPIATAFMTFQTRIRKIAGTTAITAVVIKHNLYAY